MQNFFLTLGLSGFPAKIAAFLAALVALIISLFLLIYFDTNTLFLATVLLAIITIRAINRYEESGGEHHDPSIVIDKFAGIGFALSVAPAYGVGLSEMAILSNGFLVQALLSFAFFLYFEKEKHSVIGRLYREGKGGIGIVGDDILAGFIAGIVSSLLWQSFLKFEHFIL